MGFSIGALLSIRNILLSGVQTCQLFENDILATSKRSKETHFNFKLYSIEKEVI